ncbi:MAG: hypothetical protein IJR47_00890 [Clostridia bacterium]|nr:hypothetical protein [Clostridia bacterium]
MDFEKYKELNEKISADKSLNERAMKKITEEKMKPKKIFSNFSKIAAILIAVALLSATAYAAVKGFGISDVFKVKNIDGAKQITETSDEVYTGKYASYKAKEYIFEGNLIYVCFEVKSLDDNVLMLPYDFWARNENARIEYEGNTYGIKDAEPNMSFDEYAKKNGKKLIETEAEFTVIKNGETKIIENFGGTAFYEDAKTAYLYYTFDNPFLNEKIDFLKCEFTENEWNNNDAERMLINQAEVEFEIKPSGKSQIESKTFTNFVDKEKIYADMGIRVNSLNIAETAMGVYFTFNYVPTEEMKNVKDPNIEMDFVEFYIVDANGNELSKDDIMFSNIARNADGTHSFTFGYDKQESYDGLQFYCLYKKTKTGPYPLPTE